MNGLELSSSSSVKVVRRVKVSIAGLLIVLLLSGPDRDGRRASSSLDSSEDHQSSEILAQGQSDVGTQVDDKRGDKGGSSTSVVAQGSPYRWCDGLDHHVDGDA